MKRVIENYGSTILMLFLSILMIGWMGGCEFDRHEVKGGSSVVNREKFDLAATKADLESRYRSIAPSQVIRIGFTRPLKQDENGSLALYGEKTVTGPNDYTPLTSDWLRLYRDGKEVEGRLYLSSDSMELIFVPKDFLEEGAEYKALVSMATTSKDGKMLGKDVVFKITTQTGVPLASIEGPDFIKKGESPTFTLKSLFSPEEIHWSADEAEHSGETEEKNPEVSFEYPEEGHYVVVTEVEDPYGRSVTVRHGITVLPDIEEKLRNRSTLSAVAKTDIESIPDDTLRETLEEESENVIETVEASYETKTRRTSSLRNFSGKLLHAVLMRPNAIAKWKENYLDKLFESDRFLGIVLIGGAPAILSYSENPSSDGYLLHIALDRGRTAISHRDEKQSISLHRLEGTPTPLLYTLSVPIGSKTLESLSEALPREIREVLPILHLDEKRRLLLEVPVFEEEKASGRSYGMVSTRGVWRTFNGYVSKIIETGEEVADTGMSALEQAIETLVSLVGDDILDLLKTFKSLVKKVKSLNPVENLDDYSAIASQIKNRYNSLKSVYENAGNIVATATDPDRLMHDLRNFLSKGDTNVKAFFDYAFSRLQEKKKSLEDVVDLFKSYRGNIDTMISEIAPDPSKDARIKLWISDGTAYLSLKKGSTVQNVSFDTISYCKSYLDAFNEKVGSDFPIVWLYDKLNLLVQSFPDYATALDYKASEKKIRFYAKENSTSDSPCDAESTSTLCFDTLLSSESLKSTFLVTPLPGSDGRLRMTFDPFSPVVPPMEGEDSLTALYNHLQQSCPAFPEITADLKIPFRGNLLDISATTHPDISVSASAGIGVEFNYHVLLGGKAGAALSFSVGIDPLNLQSGTLELLKNIVLEEFNATKENMGLVTEAFDEGVQAGIMQFADDKLFIDFLKNYAAGIKEALDESNLSEIAQSISFGISFEPEIGVGVGAGGTGTGGANANLKIGVEAGLSWDLGLFADSVAVVLDTYDIDTFFLSPMKRVGKTLQKAVEESAQSGDPAAALLHQNPMQQAALIFKDTFVQLIEKMRDTDNSNLINLYREMAKRMSLSFGLEIGENAEGEEAVSIEETMEWKPALSINGEALFNIIQNIAGNDTTVPYLDHAGIYPEVTLSYPFTASIEVSFDEGVKLSYGGAFQADFIYGVWTVASDPFLNDSGAESIATQNVNLKPDVIVKMSADKSSLESGESSTLTCDVTTADGVSPDVSWYIEGEKVEGTDALLYDGNTIATVIAMANNTLQLRPAITGELHIACIAGSGGTYGIDTLTIERLNEAPSKPTFSLPATDILDLDENSTLTLSATDDDGDPVTYVVQISEDTTFTNYIEMTISSPTFHLPDNLSWGHRYYLRAKATDGVAESGWSNTVSFYYHLELPVYISYWVKTAGDPVLREVEGDDASVRYTSLAEGYAFEIAGNIEYIEGAEVQIATAPDFDEEETIFSQTLYSLDEDTAYWNDYQCGNFYIRIIYSLEDANGTIHRVSSGIVHLKLVPDTPTLTTPADGVRFSHHSIVSFRITTPNVTADALPDSYVIEYAPKSDFSSDVTSSGPLAEGEWNTTLPTLDSEPYSRSYWWRARAKCNGVWSDWSAPRSFVVENRPPVPDDHEYYLNGKNMKTLGENIHICIDERIKIRFHFEDPDSDAISGATFLLSKYPSLSIERNVTVENPSPSLWMEAEYDASQAGYGTSYVEPLGKDIYGAGLERDWYAEHQEEAGVFTVVNCVPRMPRDEDIAGPSPTQTIIEGQELVFTAANLVDPDGDPIAFARLAISHNGTTTVLDANVSEDGRAIWYFTPVESGTYNFSVQAVSRYGETLQFGDENDDHIFKVIPPPSGIPIAPEDGAILFDDAISSPLELLVMPQEDVNTSAIRAIQYEWARDENFTVDRSISAWNAKDEAMDAKGIFHYSPEVGEGDWYWHARFSYTVAPGPWSETRCFSFWKADRFASYTPEPSLASSYEKAEDGSVNIPVSFENLWKGCRGERGMVEYKICFDGECTSVVQKGELDANDTIRFTPPAGHDTFYISFQQRFDSDHESMKSEPVRFDIVRHAKLTGYWNFSECDAKDRSGENRDGEIDGNPLCIEEAPKDKALYLHGDEDYIELPAIGGFTSNGPFTVSLWIEPSELEGEHAILWFTTRIFKKGEDASAIPFGLKIVDGKPRWYVTSEEGELTLYAEGVALPKNIWTHLAITYENGTITLYQNGEVAAKMSAPEKLREMEGPIYLGFDGTNDSSLYKGYIDEVKLYTYALRPEEVETAMHDIDEAFEEPFEPLESVSATPEKGEAPLTVRFHAEPSDVGIYLWDFEGDGQFDSAQGHDATHTYENPGSYEAVVMRESNGGGWKRIHIEVAPPASLVGWWNFDDCKGRDASGKHPASIHGKVTCEEGYRGQALLFDGESGYLEVPYDTELDPKALTLSFHFLPGEPGESVRQLVTRGEWGPYGVKIVEGEIVAFVYLEEDEEPIELRYELPETKEWIHVAITYDGEYFTLYVDGKAVGRSEIRSEFIRSKTPLYIGAAPLPESEEMGGYFNGTLDEIRLYDRALKVSEIGKI
ncbi:LamG-like jellyroll fold domain-containing protein [Hydrogenimonas cancrithermarum]|uniref:Ig-like domain-containing protein n=1 Tax=Hydrogenimonas cancrithermarum TaxID=2993563 RepID=A0ABM8FMV8_9BACT|nr:LamG-like jellyroll fold domain-containing protein [Hydrogenimonas cancrithermarum]BDY13734.1 hypothetical protein HCR_20460 [Hydrogenimonas cancrithermarum]